MFAASKSAKVASVAVSVTDPQINYVTTLLNGDGTNGTQNNTFLDSSANNCTVTSYGNTTQGSFAPFGTNWSNYFNGTSDYLTVAVGTSTNISANTNFTFECWVYLRAHTSGYPCIFNNYSFSGGFALFAGHNGFGSTNYNLIMGGALRNSSSTVAYNTWTHLAVVRNGTGTNNCVFYVNGVAANGATYTDNSAITSVGTNNFIGTAGDTPTSSYIDGYISNMRLVNGTAVYTTDFTPPTAPLTAITNTVLLTCQSSRFKDSSTNAFAITVTGTPSVQRFSPFSPSASYSSSTDGGSIYFDGSGDYLSFPAGASNDFGTGNFTIEMWVNPSSLTNYNMVYAGGGYLALIWGATSSVFGLNANNGVQDVSSTTTTTPINQWTHIAFVRSSGTLYFYINGVASGSGGFSSAFGSSSIVPTLGYNPAYGGLYYTNAYISNFRAVKGTAVYTTGFTPPTAPLTAITNTQLLLSGTNAGIYDSAMQTMIETVGNAQVSTAQKMFGTGSMYFDGTGDYIKTPVSAVYDFGAANFTVEMWLYTTVSGVQQVMAFHGWSGSGAYNYGWYIGINTSNQLLFYANGTLQSFSDLTISPNTWTHVAAVGTGGVLSAYKNGTKSATTLSYTAIVARPTANLVLGGWNDNVETNADRLFFTGYIDDFRITRGYARYTANFTAPTAALPTQ